MRHGPIVRALCIILWFTQKTATAPQIFMGLRARVLTYVYITLVCIL